MFYLAESTQLLLPQLFLAAKRYWKWPKNLEIMNVLQLNLKNHLMSLRNLILYTLIVALFIIYFRDDLGKSIWILIGFWTILYLAPTIVIHANHFIQSKDKSFIITDNQIKVKSGSSTKIIDFSSIVKIELHMTANEIQQSGLRHFPFEGYHFVRFFLSEEESFTISSLYSTNLNYIVKNSIKDVKIEIIKIFYPIIK